MGRIYRNQNSGLIVVSGKVKAISEDRTVLTVTAQEYDKVAKQNTDVDMKITNPIPFDAEEYKVGFSVTAIGYAHGKGTVQAEQVLVGNDVFETQDLTILKGLVKFARMNEEKDKDGNPRLKQDGTPRKPHFDITISVKEDGKFVDHTIKVYEGKTEEGQKSQLDRVKALFSKFDRENNRIAATFVTQPGSQRSYTVNRNGNEYTNFVVDHMGYKSMDVEFIDAKEKDKSAPAKAAEPEKPAPAEKSAPEQNGLNAGEIDLDGEQEFV